MGVALRMLHREVTDFQATFLAALWNLPLAHYLTLGGGAALQGVYLGQRQLWRDLEFYGSGLTLLRFADLLQHLPGGLRLHPDYPSNSYVLSGPGKGISELRVGIRLKYADMDAIGTTGGTFRSYSGAAATVRVRPLSHLLEETLDQLIAACPGEKTAAPTTVPVMPLCLDLYLGLSQAPPETGHGLRQSVWKRERAPDLMTWLDGLVRSNGEALPDAAPTPEGTAALRALSCWLDSGTWGEGESPKTAGESET